MKNLHNDSKSFLAQVRYTCKNYDDVERLSKLPIAITAYECIQSSTLNQNIFADNPGAALIEVIDIGLKALHEADPELGYLLYNYIGKHNKLINMMSQASAPQHHLPKQFSRASYYNHLKTALRMLAYQVGVYFVQQTGKLNILPSDLIPRATNKQKLTRRQEQILELSIQGCSSSRDIADRLRISKWTVQVHWKNIRAKLGAQTRIEAISLAHQRGIIDLRSE